MELKTTIVPPLTWHERMDRDKWVKKTMAEIHKRDMEDPERRARFEESLRKSKQLFYQNYGE